MAMTEYLIILYGLATLADHISTNVVLKRGGHEKNAFLASIIKPWGSTGLFVAKAGLFGIVFGYHQFVEPIADWLWIAGSAVFLGVTAMNIGVAVRQKTGAS